MAVRNVYANFEQALLSSRKSRTASSGCPATVRVDDTTVDCGRRLASAEAVAKADAVLLAVHWSRVDDVLARTGSSAPRSASCHRNSSRVSCTPPPARRGHTGECGGHADGGRRDRGLAPCPPCVTDRCDRCRDSCRCVADRALVACQLKIDRNQRFRATRPTMELIRSDGEKPCMRALMAALFALIFAAGFVSGAQ